jgi:hypothetical protein
MTTLKDKIKFFSNNISNEKKTLNRKKLIEIFKKIGNVDPKLDYNLNNASPEFCIQLLNYPHQKCISKLRKKIHTSSKAWLVQFIKANGLYTLLACIEKLCKKTTNIINSIRLSQCVLCIKEIMNIKYGMEAVLTMCIEDVSYVRILGNSILNFCKQS